MKPSSITSEAPPVYTKNFVDAYLRFGPPQMAMSRYIGMRTNSQKT